MSMGWFMLPHPANDLSRIAWRRNPCKNCKCESPTWRSTRNFQKSCLEKTLMAKTVGNKSFLPDPNRKEQVTDLFAALNSRHTKVGSSVVAKDTDGVLSDVQTSSMNSQGESLKIMEA